MRLYNLLNLFALFVGFWGSFFSLLLSPIHFVWTNLKGEGKRPINRFNSMRRNPVYSSIGAHFV